jgi:hypothetical protein
MPSSPIDMPSSYSVNYPQRGEASREIKRVQGLMPPVQHGNECGRTSGTHSKSRI